MPLFGNHRRGSDPRWEVSSGTQILVADPETVTRLADETELDVEQGATVDAVLVAVRHPTGWFVHAVRRDDLEESCVALLRELVDVRTYLLLSRGAEAPLWHLVHGTDEWRSIALSLERDLDALDDVLVD
jgi:hypothetical protein